MDDLEDNRGAFSMRGRIKPALDGFDPQEGTFERGMAEAQAMMPPKSNFFGQGALGNPYNWPGMLASLPVMAAHKWQEIPAWFRGRMNDVSAGLMEGEIGDPGGFKKAAGAGLDLATLAPLGTTVAAKAGVAAAPEGAVGMFAGARAKTANPELMAKAEKMLADGVPREQVWAETGHFKGPDGKMRFEIDDSGATIRTPDDVRSMRDGMAAERRKLLDQSRDMMSASKAQPDFWPKDAARARGDLKKQALGIKSKINENYGLTWEPGMGRRAEYFFGHEPLFGAYPELGRNVIVRQKGMGENALGFKGRYIEDNGSLDIASMGQKERLSTGLHELQHAIQGKENFARGGNPGQFSWDAVPVSEIRWTPEIVSLLEKYGIDKSKLSQETGAGKLLAQIHDRLKIKGATIDEIHSVLIPEYDRINKMRDPVNQYRALSGEVEARAVQARRDLTPEQRRARPPWLDYDVPENQQIVRFGDGVAESRSKKGDQHLTFGPKLGEHVDAKVGMDDADFWIVRRGSADKLGTVTREYNPEHIGIKLRTTKLLPDYLYYALQNAQQQGYYRGRGHGTTNLQNIRIEDVLNIPVGTEKPFPFGKSKWTLGRGGLSANDKKAGGFAAVNLGQGERQSVGKPREPNAPPVGVQGEGLQSRLDDQATTQSAAVSTPSPDWLKLYGPGGKFEIKDRPPKAKRGDTYANRDRLIWELNRQGIKSHGKSNSAKSGSAYVLVDTPEGTLKVRFSDHELPRWSTGDVADIDLGSNWKDAYAEIIKRIKAQQGEQLSANDKKAGGFAAVNLGSSKEKQLNAAMQRGEKVAPEDKLFVQHNTTAGKMGFSDQYLDGSMPVPSLGITKASHPLGGFGDITLVGHPSHAIPDAKNPVFPNDAYSTRRPETEFTIAEQSAKKSIEADVSKFYAEGSSKPSAYRAYEEMLESYKDGKPERNYTLKQMYRQQRGDKDVARDIDAAEKWSRTQEGYALEDDPGFRQFVQNYPADHGGSLKGRLSAGFTYSGKRRYKPLNIENMTRMMKTRDVGGSEGFGYGLPTLRASISRKFKSLKEIQDSRDKIAPKETWKGDADKLQDELLELGNKFEGYAKYPSSNTFGFGDVWFERIAEFANNKSKLSEYYDDVPDFLKAELNDYINKVRSIPTDYFEAKPQRAVPFSEFQAAVINPGDTAAREMLEKHGIRDIVESKVRDTSEPDTAARKEAIMELMKVRPDLFFANSGNLGGFAMLPYANNMENKPGFLNLYDHIMESDVEQ